MHWFTLSWWKYLIEPTNGDLGRIRTAICRAKGHPNGVWWINMVGDTPDMHCENCGDDLG